MYVAVKDDTHTFELDVMLCNHGEVLLVIGAFPFFPLLECLLGHFSLTFLLGNESRCVYLQFKLLFGGAGWNHTHCYFHSVFLHL